MDIVEAKRWLDSRLDRELSSVGIAAGDVEGLSLQVMEDLMSLLGDPQQQVPVIQITGTNGKGTVAAMVTALLRAHGLSVGTYTSPHQENLNERLAKDGEPISDIDLAEVLSGIASVEPLLQTQPSWFEVLTAAAFRWFAEAPVDVAVVEVGLLGRHDATNVAEADVAVITAVQGDHTDFRDGWEMIVAGEKAGIISPASLAVLGDMNDEVASVFEAEGPERLVRLDRDFEIGEDRIALGGHVVDLLGLKGRYEEVFIPLHGATQVSNAAIAAAAVELFFDRELDSEVLREAFASVELPGRFEVVAHGPLVVLDGAHNADALIATAATLDAEFTPVGTRIVVIGSLDGRDVDRTISAVAEFRPDLVICVSLGGDRGIAARTLGAACQRVGLTYEVVADPKSGVLRALSIAAEEDLVVVTGSFRILGPARQAIAAFASG